MFFFFNDTATTEIYTLSLHDALPISLSVFDNVRTGLHLRGTAGVWSVLARTPREDRPRSEEHTSELQSLAYLVCRLLLEKKKSERHMDTRLYHVTHFRNTCLVVRPSG